MKSLCKHALFALSLSVSVNATANSLTSDFLQKEVDIVFNHYLHGSMETGLYTLESYARLVESDTSDVIPAGTS